ncbi:MAG: aminoacyl-histidine dipeptidase [Defluviitaleaceae bacterium]|nr:aminoacyl-histidine dipeptidase [Defluviitaleaceae bacterium]
MAKREENKEIDKPHLILCEGKDEVLFVIELLSRLRKDEEKFNNFLALDFGGNDELATYLKEDLPDEVGFNIVKSIIILRDSEKDANAASMQVIQHLKNAGFPCPSRANKIAEGVFNKKDVKVAFSLFPTLSDVVVSGTLEDLFLDNLARKDAAQSLCEVDAFIDKLRANGKNFKQPHKSRLYTYFSIENKFVSKSLNLAAKANAFNFNCEPMNNLKQLMLNIQQEGQQMAVLANCKPTDVFAYFEKICSIPHGSRNEKALSNYIRDWAKGLGLEVIQDNLHNLIIKKPATAGYENAPTVIIQGHTDMVCEKNGDVEFDFLTQPLDIYIDGDYVRARGTTLGADNGVAVAMGMAILADNALKHPALEVVLTSVEEAGMDGAKGIDTSVLKGTRFINIDSEDEGVFLSSCAGGATVRIFLDLAWQPLPAGDFVAQKLFVGGLKGGHSGMDIAKERGNSNRLLARALDSLKTPYHLGLIDGGSKDNAIPREAFAIIYVAKGYVEQVAKEVAELEKEFSAELAHSDAGVFVRLEDTEATAQVFDDDTKGRAISLLLTTPFGVDHMSASLAGLVETSNNLGVVKTVDNELQITCACRSSVESRKWALCRRIAIIAEAFGARFSVSEGYPGWTYTPNSELRDIFTSVYKKKYGVDAQILAIHAGVECGIFADKMPGLDMISFGPNMHDVHTPDERLSISSTQNTYEFLLDVLAFMK